MTSDQPTDRHGGKAKFDEENIMVSKAIAALDVWLAEAEEVLQEQREQSISPSLHWNGSRNEWSVSLAELEDGLPELLGALCTRPGHWILIAEDLRRPSHFWQALAFEDGSLVTEVVSNTYLEGDERWTPWDEVRLAALGWDQPTFPVRPNWLEVSPTFSPPVDELASRAIATIRSIFGLEDHHELFVKLYSSPLRGNTPATADEYGKPTEAIQGFTPPIPAHSDPVSDGSGWPPDERSIAIGERTEHAALELGHEG